MAGHSRSKNGVASLAYVPAIHVFARVKEDVDARDERGHDEGYGTTRNPFRELIPGPGSRNAASPSDALNTHEPVRGCARFPTMETSHVT
jgi:hypothetical protein